MIYFAQVWPKCKRNYFPLPFRQKVVNIGSIGATTRPPVRATQHSTHTTHSGEIEQKISLLVSLFYNPVSSHQLDQVYRLVGRCVGVEKVQFGCIFTLASSAHTIPAHCRLEPYFVFTTPNDSFSWNQKWSWNGSVHFVFL